MSAGCLGFLAGRHCRLRPAAVHLIVPLRIPPLHPPRPLHPRPQGYRRSGRRPRSQGRQGTALQEQMISSFCGLRSRSLLSATELAPSDYLPCQADGGHPCEACHREDRVCPWLHQVHLPFCASDPRQDGLAAHRHFSRSLLHLRPPQLHQRGMRIQNLELVRCKYLH